MEWINYSYLRTGQPTPEIERNLMLQLSCAGVERAIIARDLGKDIETVNKWLNRYENTGLMKTLPQTRRPRCTTFVGGLNICLSAIEDPFKTVREICEQLNINASFDTFRRRLNENGLFSFVARHKELLQDHHKQRASICIRSSKL